MHLVVPMASHKTTMARRGPAALFIGRFQPFHVGHYDALQSMRRAMGRVKIVIGSSNRSRTADNPLRYGERRSYIASVVGSDVPIIPLPDHPDDQAWLVRLRRHVGPGDVVYTGNAWVAGLCRTGGITVRRIKPHIDISATRIRAMLANDDDRAMDFLVHKRVPPALRAVLRATAPKDSLGVRPSNP